MTENTGREFRRPLTYQDYKRKIADIDKETKAMAKQKKLLQVKAAQAEKKARKLETQLACIWYRGLQQFMAADPELKAKLETLIDNYVKDTRTRLIMELPVTAEKLAEYKQERAAAAAKRKAAAKKAEKKAADKQAENAEQTAPENASETDTPPQEPVQTQKDPEPQEPPKEQEKHGLSSFMPHF